MGFHIWHFMVLALSISIDFRAHAVSSDFDYDGNYRIDNFENITIVADNSTVLKCPRHEAQLSWRLLANEHDTTGKILTTDVTDFIFSPKAYNDSGFYACFVDDKLIRKFNVTVFEAPYFLRKNRPILVVKPAGNMIRLNCKASGVPIPNITWHRDDKSPPTRKWGDIKIQHWSLLLEDSVPTDKGSYTCVVCNIVGCINHTFLVDVVEGYDTPILLKGLENMTVVVGEPVSLTCQFLSDLYLSIIWKKLTYDNYNCKFEDLQECNSSTLQRSDDIKLNREVYEIYNVSHEDEGWYACFASNRLGTSASRAYLQVVDKQPDFENITIVADNSTVLKCPRHEAQLSWRLLANEHDTTGKILTTDVTDFIFSPKAYNDSGFYACFVDDKLIRKFNVTVFEAPYFLRKNRPILVVKPAGNMIRLNCKASGVPIPNITWHRDDKSPPTRKWGDIKIQHWSLLLEDSVPTDKGSYTCVVCNIVGCINHTFLVDVVERYHNTPILLNGLENRTVVVGDPVSLTCQFLSDWNLSIIWKKLTYDNYNCKFKNLQECNASTLQRSDDAILNTEVYEIYNVSHQDEGWYACFASNSLGTTVSKAYLQVVDEQPATILPVVEQ